MGAVTEEIPRPPWLVPEHFPFQSRRIHVQDHQIHYIDEGQGPILLLLHGNGSWSYGFRLTIGALAKRFRVIALDYPGLGLSVPAPGYSFLPIDHSRVVEAFVDTLQLQDIRLFVEDWGGPIGLGFAGRRPELIHSLIIANTWAWPAQGSPSQERFSKIAGSFIGYFFITRLNALARYAVPDLAIARTMGAEETQGYYMPYPTAKSRIALATLPGQILQSHEYLAQVEEGLQKLATKPTLILWGEQDIAFGAPERERLQRHFSKAEVVLLPKVKHYVHVDAPELVTEAILKFENETGAL